MTSNNDSRHVVQLTYVTLVAPAGTMPSSVLTKVRSGCNHRLIYFRAPATGILLLAKPGDESLVAPETYHTIDGGARCYICDVDVEACERCGAHGDEAPVMEDLHGEILAAHLRAAGETDERNLSLDRVDDYYVGSRWTCPLCRLHIFSGGRDTGRRES